MFNFLGCSVLAFAMLLSSGWAKVFLLMLCAYVLWDVPLIWGNIPELWHIKQITQVIWPFCESKWLFAVEFSNMVLYIINFPFIILWAAHRKSTGGCQGVCLHLRQSSLFICVAGELFQIGFLTLLRSSVFFCFFFFISVSMQYVYSLCLNSSGKICAKYSRVRNSALA